MKCRVRSRRCKPPDGLETHAHTNTHTHTQPALKTRPRRRQLQARTNAGLEAELAALRRALRRVCWQQVAAQRACSRTVCTAAELEARHLPGRRAERVSRITKRGGEGASASQRRETLVPKSRSRMVRRWIGLHKPQFSRHSKEFMPWCQV